MKLNMNKKSKLQTISRQNSKIKIEVFANNT